MGVRRRGTQPESRRGAGPGAIHAPLLNPKASIPWLHRVLPQASGAAAWLLVALVAAILLPLFAQGIPRISWDFLSQGVERGVYFNGGLLFEATFKRVPNAPPDDASLLLSLDVQAPQGEPAIAEDAAFYGSKDRPAAQFFWSDGRKTEIALGGRAFPVERGALALEVPFQRDGSGKVWTLRLMGRDLPPTLERFSVRFLVHRPLQVPGATRHPEKMDWLGSEDSPLRVSSHSGWRLTGGGESLRVRSAARSGVLPMIYGTLLTTLFMTLLCAPLGVLTAVYLREYARPDALATRIIRGAINNLAGVPSIVFGLFGLGFFVGFLGESVDNVLFGGQRVYGQPCVLWASCTLAVLTLPVVIVATEEALRAVPEGWRTASLALGATRWQTVWRIAVPQAIPGILTGLILAIGRGAGEVAPILFTGATNFRVGLPSWTGDEKFMHLGYHVYALATQSPDVERARGALFATVAVLLCLTFALNAAAIILRARLAARRGS